MGVKGEKTIESELDHLFFLQSQWRSLSELRK